MSDLLPPAEATSTDRDTQTTELDGENAGALVGVMVSERRWVVSRALKAVSFWMAVASLLLLVAFDTHRRGRFLELLENTVVEPESWGNQPAPDFTLPQGDLPQGEGAAPWALSSLRGKWVFINFWATWCPPCRDEMPSLEMMNRHLQKDGLVVVAVSVDESWGEVKRFFGDTAPSFTLLWDREKVASRAYGSSKFPESYLIDPSGVVVAKFTGPRDWNTTGMLAYFSKVMSGKRKPLG